jgi:hypothetical protein
MSDEITKYSKMSDAELEKLYNDSKENAIRYKNQQIALKVCL